jgi:hypothetical protein
MTTDPALVIDTAIGPANVLHRLALGVECLDAVTGRLVCTSVLVGREMDPLLLPRMHDPEWPCFSLPGKGVGRSYLRFDHTIPVHIPLRLRLVDPSRRFVPRRLELPLWTLAEILAAEAAPPVVPAASRILRPWLWPGSAALLPSGMTVIRGTIRTGAAPVRWARLTAVRHGDVTVGHGHADERGEFTVVITDTGSLPPPAPSTIDIDLQIIAPDPAAPPPVDPLDRYADLVAEPVARPSNPPQPAELDNPILRGTATPAGYRPNTALVPMLTVPVGTELSLTDPIPFSA